MPEISPHIHARRNNAALSAIFKKMAECYNYLGKDERFRAIAYENASKVLYNMKEDVAEYGNDEKKLDEIGGIGESIAGKIVEFLETGKIQTFEKLKRKVPYELLDLLEINGFGPATLKTLHEKLHINNREDMIVALNEGRLEKLKGFGAKKIENMKRGLKLFKETHTRILLWNALPLAENILKRIQAIPGVNKASIAGSLRRMKETIGDIDIIATANKRDWKKIINKIIQFNETGRVLAKGETKASILLKENNLQVDIRLVNENEYGSALLYFTGSKDHNITLRTWAKAKGWKMNEYGVFDNETDKLLAGRTEEEVYHLFGLQFIAPELRENRGEIEIARRKKLPVLVDEKDIKGDMQMHSTWSDGAEEIETIARFILKNYPQYEYIVMTDHSPSERVAGGLKPADFLKQFSEIDAINKKLGKKFIKKGVEVDILTDGSLDLPDNLLKQFDWVVASIHSGFTKDNTERLLKACEHPNVNCIGHPSGRLIGKREAYPVNWDKLFDKALSTNTAIEINSQPERMDLRDDLVKAAVEKGVMITISTDSHALSQFAYMPMGVAVARRGWCTRNNILNTFPWKDIERFKHKKK